MKSEIVDMDFTLIGNEGIDLSQVLQVIFDARSDIGDFTDIVMGDYVSGGQTVYLKFGFRESDIDSDAVIKAVGGMKDVVKAVHVVTGNSVGGI